MTQRTGHTSSRLAAAFVALAWTSLATAQTNPPPPSAPPAGGRDLFAMTFAGVPLGSFPSDRLEHVDGPMDVVMKDGQPMLRATGRSTFRVSLPEVLPQDFTLEFDLVPKTCCQPEDISFEGTATINQGNASANVQWHHEHQMVVGGGPGHSSKVPDDIAVSLPGVLTKIVFTMQGDQMTMFTNGQRLYTIQRKFARSRVLRVFLGGQKEEGRWVYLARLRVAANTGATTADAGVMSGRSPGTTLGAVPSGFGISVTLGGAGPVVTWSPVPGATAYRASRRKFDDVMCCNTAAPAVASPWQDQPLPVSGTYVYQVIASTPNGDVLAETQFGYRKPLGPDSVTPQLVNTNTTTTATATPLPAPVTAVSPAPTTGTATPISSRFRLVALGFKVISPGRDLDDARDGRGDEVYLTAIANQTKLTGGPLPVTKPPTAMLVPVMTRTHGDEAVSVPYGRIKAGTASSTGGLQAGDLVPPSLDLTTATGTLQQQTFPIRLWEGTLGASDDVAVVHLALWDDDVNPTVQAEWMKMISQTAQSGYATGPSYKGGVSETGSELWTYTQPPYYEWSFNRRSGDLLNTCLIATGLTPVGAKWGLCQVDGVDHPLGSSRINEPPAQWKDRFLILTRTLAEAGVAWAFDHWPVRSGEFPGTFSITFQDFSIYPYIPSAHYELYLRLERIP